MVFSPDLMSSLKMAVLPPERSLECSMKLPLREMNRLAEVGRFALFWGLLSRMMGNSVEGSVSFFNSEGNARVAAFETTPKLAAAARKPRRVRKPMPSC